jgi:hypothetical protein
MHQIVVAEWEIWLDTVVIRLYHSPLLPFSARVYTRLVRVYTRLEGVHKTREGVHKTRQGVHKTREGVHKTRSYRADVAQKTFFEEQKGEWCNSFNFLFVTRTM